MEQPQTIKYSSYTPSQKKATKKYRENNKDKVNEQRKKYYQSRKERDPNFLIYKREKAKEYYAKKKVELKEDLLTLLNVVKDIEETKEEPIVEEPIIEEPIVEEIKVIEIPVLDETKAEKKKRIYIRKNKIV